jgi:hypothetical protein
MPQQVTSAIELAILLASFRQVIDAALFRMVSFVRAEAFPGAPGPTAQRKSDDVISRTP